MRMEGNTTSISNNVGIKIEREDSNLEDVLISATNTPRPSSNGSGLQKHQEHSESKENQGQKRKKPPEDLSSKKPRETVNDFADASDDDSDAGEYCMIISEVSKLMLVDKLLKECSIVLAGKEKIGKHQVKLIFRSSEDVHNLQQKLNEKGLNWKITALPPGQDGELLDNVSDTTEVLPESLWKPDDCEEDPLGLYGLRLEFLKSLNITPPLDRWVHVTNFRCDKNELRDVLELAGRVLSCSVIYINKRYAKVQYSHPLEAVQAVSMFNGQIFYGQKLQVYMERNPNNDFILPKGLANIGLGLGLYGKPIRDVERQYEKYTEHEKSNLNPVLFRQAENDDAALLEYNQFMSAMDEKFKVRHAFELDSIGVSRSDVAKMSCSPDSNSAKSINSPGSINEDKDSDRTCDFNKTVVPASLPQPEVPGSTNPINQSTSDPCLNKIPSLSVRSHVVPSNQFKPGPPGPQVQAPRSQHPGVIRSGPPNPHNLNSNLPNPNSFGYSQSFNPQMQGVGPAPINRPVYGTGPIQPSGSVQGPAQIRGPGPIHGPGPVQGPRPGPIHGPGPVQGPRPVQATGPMFGPGYNRGPNPNTMPTPGPMGVPSNKVAVQLSNLPPSTTFPLLCEKLSHCGQVMSLQFTTPGCAIATFGHSSHAERCFQTYNGMTVEGYTIVVTFM